ncbi:MAG: IS1595 family transposase [Rhodospirillales bacterium]|nr:IS1595 family transposase [Rhodospirillales bacterium]
MEVDMSFTVTDFFKRFPTDDDCLDHLMSVRFGDSVECPKCHKVGKFSRVKKIPAYACAWCGHHIHPMAGTPFQASRTPLQKWFYAMYLFTTSRHGVPAKELQRQLGVTYKCAWRMGHEIRKYMAQVDGDDGLSGIVEADEAYIGGKGDDHQYRKRMTTVLGMVERGGDIITRVIPDTKVKTMIPHIQEHVAKGSTVTTDELHAYKHVTRHGFKHTFVKHRYGEYVNGDAHTNTIEGFWSILKRSIRGTHVWVSKKHMSKYLGEFEYRYNMRHVPELMFTRLLKAF